MRTSLNEIKLIDEHIFNNGAPADAALFDAMLVLDPGLAEQVLWQKKSTRDHYSVWPETIKN